MTINSQQTLNATGCQGKISETFGNQVEEYILNGNITIIPEFLFNYSSFTSITLPETLTEIGDGAFRHCSLTSITIPASVTSIGLYSFWNCPLQSITVNATTPPTLNSSFLGVSTSIPVYVPEGTVDTYKAATYWKDFTNFIEITLHKLFLVSSNTSLGKVYGAGRYDTTTEVTIYAAPEAGCKFTGWSDGNTENPRQYVVMSDATLTANFEAENIFPEPTGAGPRMKVTKKDNKVYEFKTQDVKNVSFYQANE